jgi:hypothetical protein
MVSIMNRVITVSASVWIALSPAGRPGSVTRAGVAPRDSASAARDTVVLAAFPSEEMSIERWLDANGWKEERGSAAAFVVRDGALFMHSANATTVIGKKLSAPIDPVDYPQLEFRFKVDAIPPGADVTSKQRDDAAFRLFVVFDAGGGLLSPPATIGYAWDSTRETSSTGRSARFGQVRYIVIGSGTAGLGTWTTCRRDIAQDYRLLFGDGPVPKVAAVALKCDTNHSKSRAASAVEWVRLLPRTP